MKGTKIVFSKEPGGVFGLAPVKTAAPASSEPDKEGKKKPKRHRSRRAPKKGMPPAPQDSTREKISTA
jgi:hypothetical protein